MVIDNDGWHIVLVLATKETNCLYIPAYEIQYIYIYASMLNANCTSVSLSFDCQLFNYYNLKNGGLEVEHDL